MKTKKIKNIPKSKLNQDGEKEYCVYTDSCPGFEPIVVKSRESGLVDVRPIADLENCWQECLVWSDDGFVRINDFIKKPLRKNLFTVRTQKGVVHVTEDHSLIKSSGNPVKPKEVEVGNTELLHKTIGSFERKTEFPKKCAWFFGFFTAVENSRSFKSKKEIKKLDEALKQKVNVSSETKSVAESESSTNSSVYSNIFDSGRGVLSGFENLCYSGDKTLKVPPQILNAKNSETIEAFLEGYSDGGDQINRNSFKRRHWFDSPVLAQGINLLFNRLDQSTEVDYRRSGGKENIGLSSLNSWKEEPEKVEQIEIFDYNGDYVYDLETENHHFACGVGSIVVHNTDSVFYPAEPIVEKQMPNVDTGDEEDMTDAILEIADEVEDYLNACYNHFARELAHIPEDKKHWFEIKQELVAKSGLWVRKKRYAQWIINDEGDPTDELDVKGLDIIRSDFPTAFRELLEDVIVSILKGSDKDEIDKKVLDFRENLKNLNLEDVARPTGVGDLEDYHTDDFGRTQKGAPAHFVGALNYNDLIKHFGLEKEVSPIKSGSKIKWVYLNKNNLGFDKMAFKGQGDPEKIMEFLKDNTDFVKLYEKSLKSKVEAVYEAMDWNFPSENKRQAQKFFSM